MVRVYYSELYTQTKISINQYILLNIIYYDELKDDIEKFSFEFIKMSDAAKRHH